jgi:tetratricopeptide (TPR) repeat protein
VANVKALRQDLAVIREQSTATIFDSSVNNQFVVPHQRNMHFTGRERLIAAVRDELNKSTLRAWSHRIALYGLGGVGKTQLALEYAYTFKQDYNGVYWISAVSQATLFSGFQEIAKQTRCVAKPENLKPSALAEQVLRWLNEEENWLLVFDNLDDVAVVDGYLPDISRGHTLITTRNQHYDQIPAEGMEVGILESEDAVNLLLIRCKVAVDGADGPDEQGVMEVASEIVKELGFLPLAVEQAAGYIREASKDIFKFLPSYRQNRKTHHARVSKGNRNYYSESLATTWRLSFQRIEQSNSDASKLLQLLAFLNPDGTWMDFLEAGKEGLDGEFKEIIGDHDRLCEALAELQRFSLIRRQTNENGQRISIHRLVQSVIRDEMPPVAIATILDSLIKLCNAAFPPWHDWDLEALLHQSRLYEDQVVGPLLEFPILPSETFGCLLSRVGLFLREDGKFQQAEEVLTKSWTLFGNLKGAEHHETLNAMALLAWCHQNRGQHQQAADLEQQVLETRLRLLGDEHPDTLETMAILARTYRTQAKYSKAEKLKEHVLAVRIKNNGEEDPETLMAMSYLAHTYKDQGRLRQAATLEERVVEVRTRLFPKEHPSTLLAMGNLGFTYRSEGRYKEAAELEEKVLEATMRLLGKEHPETVLAMVNLGCTYREQDKFDHAIVLLERAVEGRKMLGGTEHPCTLWAQFNLSVAYQKSGNASSHSVVQLLESTTRSMEKVLGAEHPWTLCAMFSLSVVYRKQGRLDVSQQLLMDVVERRRRVLGDMHPSSLESSRELESWKEPQQKVQRTISCLI